MKKRIGWVVVAGTLLGTLQPSTAPADPWTSAYFDCNEISLLCPAYAQNAYDACVAQGRGGTECQAEYNAAHDACENDAADCTWCQRHGQAVWKGYCEATCVTEEHCTIGYTNTMQMCHEGITDECGCCRVYSPLVVILKGIRPHFSSAEDGVVVDMDGKGTYRQIAWPTHPDTAWLGLDRNGNGRIDSLAELFGNTMPLSSGGFATDGYKALAELDSNRDGRISRKDARYNEILLWRDVNRDGTSEPGELVTLSEAGVLSLSLDAQVSTRRDRWGNAFRLWAKVRFRDRRPGFSYDVFPMIQLE